MKESVTYQAILQEGRQEGEQIGRIEEARITLLRLGSKRFGPPKKATLAKIEASATPVTLENLIDRIYEVENWRELFAA